jgi:hypothetical protein
MNFVTSWVEEKTVDSCYDASFGFIPKVLLNMMNENGKVSRSHGLPLSIFESAS